MFKDELVKLEQKIRQDLVLNEQKYQQLVGALSIVQHIIKLDEKSEVAVS